MVADTLGVLPVTRIADGVAVVEIGRTVVASRLGAGPQRRFRSALPTVDGDVVLVDGHRRSVLMIKEDRLCEVPSPFSGGLWRDPVFAEPVGDRFLVSDAGSGCVVECDISGKSYWTYDTRAAGWLGGPTCTARDPASGTTYIALPDSGSVIGVDGGGAVVWRYQPGGDAQPVAVWSCRDGGILVTDRRRHTVDKVGPHGTPLFSFGHPGQPDSRATALNTPNFACETAAGSFLISDTKNNRLLEAAADGRPLWIHGNTACGMAPGLLRFPMTAVRRDDGTVLVADCLNGRILLISDESEEALFGDGVLWASELALPRGSTFAPDRRIRVTDCYNNRVLLVDTDGSIAWQLDRLTGEVSPNDLWWPRFWAGTPDDAVIADGRRGRLVRTNREGEVRAQLTGYRLPDGRTDALRDPHHLQILPSLNLLVCDSGADRVLEVDWSGRVHWFFDDLEDPHQAERLPSGTTLMADTGHNRIVEVDATGRPVWTFDAQQAARATGAPLAGPRSAKRLRSGDTLVLDSDNNRLLQVGRDHSVRWTFQPSDWDSVGSLCAPRHVDVDQPELTIAVSDFENHRVLILPRGYLPAASVATGQAVGRR